MPESITNITISINTLISQVLNSFLYFVLIIIFALILWAIIKRYWQKHRGLTGTLLLVSLPRWDESSDEKDQQTTGSHISSARAAQMFAELHGFLKIGLLNFFLPREVLSFEILANHSEIKFYLFCPRHLIKSLTGVIHSSYPEAEVDPVPDYNLFDKKSFVDSTRLTIKGPLYAPLKIFEEFAVDPLNSITNKMASLEVDEKLLIQAIFTPAKDHWRRKGFKYLNSLKSKTIPDSSGSDGTTSGIKSLDKQTAKPKQVVVDEKIYQSVEKKLSHPGFSVSLNLFSISPDKAQATANLEKLALSFSQFNQDPLSKFYKAPTLDRTMANQLFLRLMPLFNWPWSKTKLILNAQEIASIFHFPSTYITTPRIHWLKAKKAPAETHIPTSGLHLGYNTFRGLKKPIYINEDDRRRHMYFLGQTGTGKTELMKYMIYQDILKGHGVCYIDPHGDAVEDLLSKIPKNRLQDVIYFNPADTQRPPGLNILEASSTEEKHIIINSFISLLYKLYDPNRTGIMGPMLERAVRNVMLTAMEEPGNTLIEVLRLLTSPKFAKTKIPLIKDPVVKTYWTEELARTSDFHKSEMLGYFVSKFDHFVTDVTIRNIIGQGKSAFSFKEVMNSKKIVLINLAKGKIGEENASFLGLLLIPKILIAAMSRQSLPEQDRTDFYLYVDEFQNFATPDFIQILSESRKFHLNLIIANQYLEQIPKPIRDALFGNVGSLGSFRVGDEDAAFLEFHFKPVFSKYDLANNMIGNLYFKMLVGGVPSLPFSMSLDWDEVSKIAKSQKIRQIAVKLSRVRFGQDRSVVEQDIARRSDLTK